MRLPARLTDRVRSGRSGGSSDHGSQVAVQSAESVLAARAAAAASVPAATATAAAPAGTMPLVEHLRELRRRLVFAILAIAVGVVVAFFLWEPVYAFLRQPYCGTPQGSEDCNLYSLGIFDQFKVRMRVAVIGGVLLSAPVWLYHLGAFITPALHRHERRYAFGFLAASLVFFLLGCGFAFVTIGAGLEFLLNVAGGGVVTLLSVQSYLSFITLCLLAFGVAFEFPVLVLFLHLTGALPAAKMRSARRGVILGIAVASAVITPSQDPITFLAMAAPLWVLYEGCILIARVRERAAARRRAADPNGDLSDDEPSRLEAPPEVEPAAGALR